MTDQARHLALSHIVQIDVIKGLAIIAVLLQHTITVNNVVDITQVVSGTTIAPQLQILPAFLLILLVFTTRQAVPVFVVLLGVNAAISYIRRGYTSLRDGYSKEYCLSRVQRLYIPFLIILLASLLIGLIETCISNNNPMHLNLFALAGLVPIYAPGNYFVLLVFQFTIVFPLLFYLYKRYPRIVIAGCFLIGFATQSVGGLLLAGTYQIEILRYLPGIALGLWIAQDFDMFARKNRFILYFIPISISVIVLNVLSRYNTPLLPFSKILGIMYPLVFFFPLFLVLLGIRYFPKNSQNKLIGMTTYFGKASYHIFLVQMLYFNIFTFLGILKVLNPGGDLILNLAITIINATCCLAIGILFMKISNDLVNRIRTAGTKITLYNLPLLKAFQRF